MIGTLNQKLLRDIWKIKGQMLAISMVMAAGIAVFIIMFGVLDSLKLTKDTYYDRYQFADVFASLKRAPNSLVKQIEEIPDVALVQDRVVFGVTLQMPEMIEPATGLIISYPDHGEPLLNKVYLRHGRLLFPNETDAILVDESFFKAHGLELGDKVSVIMNGLKRKLTVVGAVLSPEYVYTIAPGAMMPDAKRYGVFFMSRRSLEAAVNMKGAFNDLSVKVDPSADTIQIKSSIDQVLKNYGGLMAYDRKEQISNFFVENELKQLNALGWLAPIIFLSVAAFLVNVVMSRQIATQREQIGMLKAIGYSDLDISLHFLKMVIVVSTLGALIGLVLGSWMGSGMTAMYTEFFHFPILKYSFSIEVMIIAVFSCFIAAVVGTLVAINNAVKLPPAEAMRPESPPVFKRGLLDRLKFYSWLSHLSKIIVRQLERRFTRALLSSIGMGCASAVLVFSLFMKDSMDYLLEVQYEVIQREDINISFIEPRSTRALEELKALPGVLQAEPLRQVPVKLRFNQYYKKGVITGLSSEPQLSRVVNKKLMPVRLPERGILLNSKLAEILNIQIGNQVTVEVLEGKRQQLQVPVVNIVEEFIGTGAYMNLTALNQLLDEPPKMSGAALLIDQKYAGVIFNRLKSIPQIVGLNIVSVLKQIFDDIMAENLLKMVTTNILFACIISFGVIYNTARIALSERGRELASLRVLGLTRREVAYLLFGELSIITLVSLPLGCLIGIGLAHGMVNSMESEIFRIPMVVNRDTFGYAITIVLFCALLSFYMVWQQVEKIDLVSAQKGVE